MGKKGKGKGKGKDEPAQGKQTQQQARQGQQPQRTQPPERREETIGEQIPERAQPPQRAQPPTGSGQPKREQDRQRTQPTERSAEGAAKGKGKGKDESAQGKQTQQQSRQESQRAQQPQRTQPPERSGETIREQIPERTQPPQRAQPSTGSGQPKREQDCQRTQQTERSAEGAAKGHGRGRGHPTSEFPVLPKVGQQPAGTFFAADTPQAVGEAPTTKSSSSQKKTVSKLEEQELLQKAVGLSLGHESPVKYTFAKRPDYGVLGQRISVFVNYFKLKYKDTTIYHYDIDISEATKDDKKGESLMSQGRTAKEDIKKGTKHVERQKRRNLGKAKCRAIIAEMIKLKSLQRFSPVYDGQKNVFTSQPLPFEEKKSFPVELPVEGKIKKYFVTIQPVEKKDMSNIIDLQPLIDMYNKKSNEIPQEVLLAYETVMNHREPPFNQVQFRNSFFSLNRENVHPLGCGLEIWYGYHQSVHLTELGPVVVINLAAKAFHKSGPVIEYAKDVLGEDITRKPRLENWQINSLTESLKGVHVKVTHQRHPRKYKVKCITSKSAKEIMFEDGKRKISVADYFIQKYQRKLDYPHLPCIQMQSNNNTTFIPMETCVVVEGQPKIGKLSGELTSKMIRSTAVPPEDRFKQISNDARKVNDISKKFLTPFGLLMDVNLMKVDGRIIAAPQLKYDKTTDHPSQIATPDKRGVWRIEDGKKFYDVVIIKNWCLISFADDRRFGDRVLTNFCEFLVRSARKCGMQMDRPTSVRSYGPRDTTEQAILQAKKSGAQFAIVVLNRRDNKHTYDEVKFLADFRHNLVTQCMEDKTLSRINDQITTNVCLKINVKLGGINHILLHRPIIFSAPVMVIGADAIHWTRGFGYPSIVSVVTSLNPTASRYALMCHTQRNIREGKISQEIIRNMKDIAIELIKIFMQKARASPLKIIVFRDGVSEGQFQHALEYEVSGIQEACKDLFNGKILPITYMVVQKRHQTRLKPERDAQSAGKCKNVPPGTVVDKDIVHPVLWDFFICSHEGIQGTSKPAKYTILHDDNNFKSDSLQQLCHFLCHTYVRCTRSVSLPAPILYADLAAFRAKKYADLHIRPDDASSVSSNDEIERDFPPHVHAAIRSMQSFENNMFYV